SSSTTLSIRSSAVSSCNFWICSFTQAVFSRMSSISIMLFSYVVIIVSLVFSLSLPMQGLYQYQRGNHKRIRHGFVGVVLEQVACVSYLDRNAKQSAKSPRRGSPK